MKRRTIKEFAVKPLPADLVGQLRPIVESFLVLNSDVDMIRRERRAKLVQIKADVGLGPVLRFARIFVANAPAGVGIERRRKWWRMMLHIFSFDEALEKYLEQIPRDLTSEQRQHLYKYLTKDVGFGSSEVEVILKRFGCKPSNNRRRDRRDTHISAYFMVP